MKAGLSDGRVDCILQDSHGFLWFGAQDGLNRFDGYNFTVFGHDVFDSTSISSDWIRCILEDHNHNLWIGTEGGGLNRFDFQTEKFTRWMHNEDDPFSLNDNFVRALCEDSYGELWIGTRSGLSRFDREQKRFMQFTNTSDADDSVFNENVTRIIEDKEQNLWVGTSNSIYRINAARDDLAHYEFQDSRLRITAIRQDSYGSVWFGSRYNGILVYDPKRDKFDRFTHQTNSANSLSSNEIKDIFEDKDENLWIATMHGGLNLFDRKARTFHHFEHDNNDPSSLSSNSIRSIFQDRTGVVWLGTDGSGIDTFYKNRQKFQLYSDRFDLAADYFKNTVLSIYEDSRGFLWIGTEGGGLHRFSKSRTKPQLFKNKRNDPYSLSSDQVTCLLEDRDGNLWIGTKEGLNKYHNDKGIFHQYFVPITPVTGNNFINTIIQDGDSGLWLGTNSGLFYFDKSKGGFEEVEFDESDLLSDEVVNTLWLDADRTLWIGYLRSGLVAYHPDDSTFTHFRSDADVPNSLSSNFVQHIFRDSKNRLWIATRKGLNRYDHTNNLFVRYLKADGLPSDVIACIAEDNDGNIWTGTTNGLSRFDTDELTFTNYNAEDGLQGNQFWNRSCFKSRSGELFFGGNNGFNSFYPDRLKNMANPLIPPIAITSVRIQNQPIERSLYPYITGSDTLVMAFKENRISLEFAALDYTQPERNQFAYMLEGFDTDWNYSGTRRYANYTNLAPGLYTFKVKGTNNDGVWNQKGASLSIYIPTPFNKTMWAYLLYGGIIIGLIYGINAYIFSLVRVKHDLKLERIERKKALEINQFKLQFFTDIAHEFKTPLTLIQAPLEEMLASTDKKNPHSEEMNVMYRNVRYLMRLVQQLLCFRRVEHNKMALKTTSGDLVDFTRKIFELFAEAARKHEMKYEFFTAQSSIQGWFDWEKMEEILVNLLDNAMKYTPDRGAISVSLSVEKNSDDKNTAVIRLKDSGVGISDDQITHIFERFYQAREKYHSTHASSGLGLALTKKLVEMHCGIISVTSSEGEGSEFVVSLPLGSEHLRPEEMLHNVAEQMPGQLFVSEEEEADALYDSDQFADQVLNGEKPLVLIVEDNADMRAYMKKSLSKQYIVAEAADGVQGLKTALNVLPNIIISDVMMPEKDGITLCRELKENISTSHIPVILLTAQHDVEKKIKGIEFGADDYIEKPFHIKLLHARIVNMLQSRVVLRERYRKELISEPEPVKAFSHDERFLQQIRQYVEQNLDHPDLSVNHLTVQAGVSRTMLFTKLKELVGYTPQEFLKVLRLKKAAQLLLKTDYTVSEIAYQVGFKYPKYFSTCFLQEYGQPPSDYRETEKQKIN